MTLAVNADQLPKRILALTRTPTLRRTIMKQCKLAGYDELQITKMLGRLIAAGYIEHSRSQTDHPEREPIRYQHRRQLATD